MGIEEVEKGVAMLTAEESTAAGENAGTQAVEPESEKPAGKASIEAGKPAEKGAREGRSEPDASAEPVVRSWQELAENYGAKSPEQFKPLLDDLQAMYAVLEGRAEPGPTLDFIRKSHPGAFEKIANYFAAETARPQGENAEQNPLAEKVNRLERAWQSREDQAERQRVFATFTDKVKELGKATRLDGDEIEDYATRIAAKIGGDPKIIERIARGNFADVQRLFTEVHNRELERLKRNLDSQVASKTRRNQTLPKVPAGGAPPAPTATPKHSLATWEERTAAAREEWDRST